MNAPGMVWQMTERDGILLGTLEHLILLRCWRSAPMRMGSRR